MSQPTHQKTSAGVPFLRTRVPALCVATVFATLALWAHAKEPENAKVRWDMINVNTTVQGDAHLIRGASATVLVDTGHAKVAADTLLPFLRGQRVRHIDAVIITHGHHDHYGGLLSLLKRKSLHIGVIYMTRPSLKWMQGETFGVLPEEIDAIEAKARERGVPIRPVQEFTSIAIGGGYELRKLFAATEAELAQLNIQDINDLSLIATLDNGKVSALFTGDLNNAYSEHLAALPDTSIFRADILKFPHHALEGFASDRFIRLTQAKVFMAPIPPIYDDGGARGERARTLARDMKATTYKNSTHGHVSVTFRGDRYTIRTER